MLGVAVAAEVDVLEPVVVEGMMRVEVEGRFSRVRHTVLSGTGSKRGATGAAACVDVASDVGADVFYRRSGRRK
jgi:hypothetical protein